MAQTPVQRRKNQQFAKNVNKRGSIPTTLKKVKTPEEAEKEQEDKKKMIIYFFLAIFAIGGVLSFLQLFVRI